ncbi:MAG: hypothetical protein ACYTBS_11870 [Planctomycetota bacterium]
MSNPVNFSSIKRFAKETLGCACPDEVFEQIECDEGCTLDATLPICNRLLIGNRLLIYLWEAADAEDLSKHLARILACGKKERDDRGYNRFRLVVSTLRPEELQDTAQKVFKPLAANDEKLHLHVVSKEEMPQLIA